jgi:hypothetical protein
VVIDREVLDGVSDSRADTPARGFAAIHLAVAELLGTELRVVADYESHDSTCGGRLTGDS